MPGGATDIAAVDIAAVAADLQALGGARILLGHQSVGRNILAGVAALAAETGADLRIVEIDVLPPDPRPGLFHAPIGANGDPDSKCQMFQRLLERPERPAYDLAMMKFCYVDLGRDTPLEAQAMLERYAATIGALRLARPDVRIVHSTLPLRTAPAGWKATIKRVIGRPPEADADNALRSAFNDGLRARFAAEPIFDLARIESTRPDGNPSSIRVGGRLVPVLDAGYSNDGGHLNTVGQRRAAAEFLHTLAAALPSRTAGL